METTSIKPDIHLPAIRFGEFRFFPFSETIRIGSIASRMSNLNQTKTSSGNKAIYWLIALVLAGILLYFSLRGIDWPEVWRIVSRAYLPYVLLALLISTFS